MKLNRVGVHLSDVSKALLILSTQWAILGAGRKISDESLHFHNIIVTT
jgi:hypothetical protein